MRLNSTFQRQIPAAGYTLIELIVSMGVASVLLVGLPSSIYIASQAFSGNTIAVSRSTTAQIQSDIINDLKYCLSFSELTANAVTMTVPDRDNDGVPEIIRYSWSGTNGDPLVYQYNGGTAANIAEDVYNFNLTNITRFIAGPVIPAPDVIVDSIIGYDTLFATEEAHKDTQQIALQVTVDSTTTIKSVSAYLKGGQKAGEEQTRVAIYTDNNGEPDALIVESETMYDLPTGWQTISVPDTVLVPGTYWLAFAIKKKEQRHYIEEGGAIARVSHGDDVTIDGFLTNWGSSTHDETYKVSIFGASN